jgi:hypothetical protein
MFLSFPRPAPSVGVRIEGAKEGFMMDCWVLVSEGGEVVVKNDTTSVRIIIRAGLYPMVKCGADCFYPRTWQGSITRYGEVTTWQYPAGPIRELSVEKGSGENIWVSVIWR